jgi:hypothetical protein
MTISARAAVFAAAFTLVAVPRLDAQSSKISVTIAGGPHAGTYEMSDQCEVNPDKFPSMFMMAYTVGAMKPNSPRSIEFFTASGKGKPDGFVVAVQFPGTAGERIAYELNALPPELKPPVALPPQGRGGVTVRQTATGRTAAFHGVTHDGVRMEGSVDCRTRS